MFFTDYLKVKTRLLIINHLEMNFLAHIFLSGEGDDLLKLGNFMGDTVRGKQYLNYPKEIQQGILLQMPIHFFDKVKRGWCLFMDIMQE